MGKDMNQRRARSIMGKDLRSRWSSTEEIHNDIGEISDNIEPVLKNEWYMSHEQDLKDLMSSLPFLLILIAYSPFILFSIGVGVGGRLDGQSFVWLRPKLTFSNRTEQSLPIQYRTEQSPVPDAPGQ